MARGDTVTMRVWLIGGGDPLVFGKLPLEEAQRVQREIVQQLEAEQPSGSFTMGDGTLVRYAAIAASRIVMPSESKVRVLN